MSFVSESFEYRPRAASDPTYVSQYPERPSSYRVHFAPDVERRVQTPTQTPSRPRDLGSSSRTAMGIRPVIDSSMMTIRSKCEEVTRYLNELSKSAANGGGEELQRQFIEAFPELVSAIFGLPLQSTTSNSGGAGPNSSMSSMLMSAGSQQRGWLVSAVGNDDFEALFQLLKARSSLLNVLLQLSSSSLAPMYVFPINTLPVDAYAAITNSNTFPGGSAEGQAFQFLLTRMGRNRQPGLTVSALEYYLLAFCWYATQSDADSRPSRSTSTAGGSIIATNRSMANVLYSSLVRQYGIWLLEMEASDEVAIGSMFRPGRLDNTSVSMGLPELGGFFRFFVSSSCMFWLHQNTMQLFLSTSGVASLSGSTFFMQRSRYVAPTFLMICSLHDLLTLLVHTSVDLSSVFGGSLDQWARGDMFSTPTGAAAGRISGQLLRDVVHDPLYCSLKLGLMFSETMWPYLVSLWEILASPWLHLPDADAYTQLAVLHERQQRALQRQVPLPADQPEEEFPFSTIIANPYAPESLKSPFIVPAKKAVSAGAKLQESFSAAKGGVISHLGLTSLFSPSSPTSSSPTSSTVPGSTLLNAPQNWSWFTFHDPEAPAGYLWRKRDAQAVVSRMDERSYVVVNYPVYAALLRTWLLAVNMAYVEQRQPLYSGVLMALDRVFTCFNADRVRPFLQEIEASVAQPLDRFSEGRFEMEKRIISERWIHLERAMFTGMGTLGDARLRAIVHALLKEAHVFSMLVQEGGTLKERVARLNRESVSLFSLNRSQVDAELAQAAAEAASSHGSGSSSRSSHDSFRQTSNMTRLTQDQQQALRQGRFRTDQRGIGFTGDVWDKPITTSESWLALWVLYRFSLLTGLAERRGSATKTYFNLRPLGTKAVWIVVSLLIVLLLLMRLAGGISINFDFGDEEF